MDILVPKIEKNSKIDHVSQEKNYIDEIFELNNQIRLKIPKVIAHKFQFFYSFYRISGDS